MMRPETESDLAGMLRDARDPVSVRGGGTRGMAMPGTTLETGGLSGVRLYEPGALTLVVGAGTPLDEVEALLADRNQRLAFEPMDHRVLLGGTGRPTIGGVVAANVSGPRRVQVGACRDHLLGVRFVDGTGTVIANGGRVMKNVTGYDLVKLMAGARGTLGVLTELSLKVLAIPQAEATLILRGQETEVAVADLCRAMGTPFDVSGAAYLQPGLAGPDGERRLRIEGLSGSIAYRAQALDAALGGGHEIVEGAESAALWSEVRDVAPLAGRPGAVWRLSVRPSGAPGVLRQIEEDGIAHQAMLDWSGGLAWVLVEETGDEAGDAGAAVIRRRVAALGGHATLVRAGGDIRARVPMFQPENAFVERVSAGLRARFDPRGILNPGLMAAA